MTARQQAVGGGNPLVRPPPQAPHRCDLSWPPCHLTVYFDKQTTKALYNYTGADLSTPDDSLFLSDGG
ncbi:MAG TPA: hypothetical protein VNJ09_10810 [Chthonomonadales bacterium]|nr:hypothetical protein [Chthonomonadales bacterium]